VPDPVEVAEDLAAEMSTAGAPLGVPGRRFDRRSPFLVGALAAAGVAMTYGVLVALAAAQHVLLLITISAFLAVGLDPVVTWLTIRGLHRWGAVTLVLVVTVAAAGGLLALTVPPLATQAAQLVAQAPDLLHQAQDNSSTVGKLNAQFNIQARLTEALNGSTVLDNLVGAVAVVVNTVIDLVTVVVLFIFFLAEMPQIRSFGYRLIPHARRPRAILIGDEILAKVGAYVLGNVVISVIAAAGTFAWLVSFGIPYPLLLALFVAVLDLIPVVGSSIAGIVVTAVALTVSLPVAVGTVAFFIAFRLVEDYVLTPRIIGRAVDVPALTTIIAVLLGGAVLGIVGALIAIPVAAAAVLILNEVLYPRLDHA
jgi:predicted PurR-regulated permease PerM